MDPDPQDQHVFGPPGFGPDPLLVRGADPDPDPTPGREDNVAG